MNKLLRITALVGSLWAVPAVAADNALVVTPGSGVTVRSIDIGAGVQAPGHALVDATGGQLGVSGSPLYVRVPSAAIASGAYASGSVASGAFASGSVSSGAFASGALASGSIAAGAMVDLLTMRGTVAAGTAAANSMLTGCVYNSTPITLTNGQQAAVQCSVNGYPTVTVSNTNANGQATMANSSPVVIASNQTAIPVTNTPAAGTSGGATPAAIIAANSNNSTSLKGSAGMVYGVQTSNIDTAAAWLKLYDKATAPTCGTDTPVGIYLIPPSNSGNNVVTVVGKVFTLGIGYCIVTGIATNDNTAVPAAKIAVNFDYK